MLGRLERGVSLRGKGQATGRTQDGGEICQIILIILHITCHRTNKSLLGRNKTKTKCSHVGKKKISGEKLEGKKRIKKISH